jgi:hypothetical protein
MARSVDEYIALQPEPVPVKLIARIAKFRAKETPERKKAKAATPKKR